MGLVLALRKAAKPGVTGGESETGLRRLLFTQAILGTLAYQIALVIEIWNNVWPNQAGPALFAIGSIALVVNLLVHLGGAERHRSPRQSVAAVAVTVAISAALLLALREYYAFLLIYVLWVAQFVIGINRLASAGKRRFAAALSILFVLMGLSTFLVVVNPFDIPPWEP